MLGAIVYPVTFARGTFFNRTRNDLHRLRDAHARFLGSFSVEEPVGPRDHKRQATCLLLSFLQCYRGRKSRKMHKCRVLGATSVPISDIIFVNEHKPSPLAEFS